MTPPLRPSTVPGATGGRRDTMWQAAFTLAGQELLLDRHLEETRRWHRRIRTATQAAERLEVCDRAQAWLDGLDEHTFNRTLVRRAVRLRRRVARDRRGLERALRRPAMQAAIVRDLLGRSDAPGTAPRDTRHAGGVGVHTRLVAVSGRVGSPRVRLALHLYRRREADGSWLVAVPPHVHTALVLAGRRNHFQVSRAATVAERETLDAACALWSSDPEDLYHDPENVLDAARWLQ